MISVLEKVKDREPVSSEDGELYLAAEEGGEEEESSTAEPISREPKFELGKDLLDLYFTEVGRTRLLSDEETKMLTSQIEDGKHLVRLEKEWVAEHGAQPSAIELFLALAERLTGVCSLFESIYQYLKLPSHKSIAKKVLHPDLRGAIDDRIDERLADAVAEGTGANPAKIEKRMIELSLDSRLTPWYIMEQVGRKTSLAGLGELLQLPEFRDKLG